MADLVIDASLAASWCFPDERTDYTNAVLHTVSSALVAFAPRLWAYEVRNGVLVGLRRGRISKADAEPEHQQMRPVHYPTGWFAATFRAIYSDVTRSLEQRDGWPKEPKERFT